MGLPWTTILLHGPTIVEAARKLYAATRKTAAEPPPAEAHDPATLRRAVDVLAERQAQQAALLQDLARQLQEVATAVHGLRRRVAVALAGAALAGALALAGLALALWRS